MKSLIDKIAVLAGKGKYHTPENAPEWWHPYFQSRPYYSRKKLCYAPFNSMYFNVRGEVAPCWLTLETSEKFPEKSIREIWWGEKFQHLRESLSSSVFPSACKVCKENLSLGNNVSVLSRLYDVPYPQQNYPSVMEFELSNRCNLECVMCKGELSSSIRKNREQLPALRGVYDATFTRQLEEFIPHLKEAKFLGGEPFLIDIYYEIWDLMISMNPEIEITITTNATVFNQKVEKILEKLKCNIIISIDSLEKSTYENIRLNGNFERVMENVEKFREHAISKKKYIGLSFNPMRRNCHEIKEVVKYCNKHQISLWLNTVVYPFKESLLSLDDVSLLALHQQLSEAELKAENKIAKENIVRFNNFKDSQLYPWYLKAKSEREAKEIKVQSGNFKKSDLISSIESHLKNDHYLSVIQRDKIWNDWKSAIENIHDEAVLQKLYLMTAQDCLEKIHEFDQLQN